VQARCRLGHRGGALRLGRLERRARLLARRERRGRREVGEHGVKAEETEHARGVGRADPRVAALEVPALQENDQTLRRKQLGYKAPEKKRLCKLSS
jgi:hypothetical protein